MATMNDDSPITGRLLFSMKDLNITFTHISMESGKYICVIDTCPQNNVVIINMIDRRPLRLAITADWALMNPHSPILTYKDRTKPDQLQMFNVEAKKKLKSYDMAEKVIYWKWIKPKLLGLVTPRAIYHWSAEELGYGYGALQSENIILLGVHISKGVIQMAGLTGPIKMFDRRDKLATHSNAVMTNYLCEPSEKWHALVGHRKDSKYESFLFIWPRGVQSGQPPHSFNAHAAAFTTLNVQGNNTPSTRLFFAHGRCFANENGIHSAIELSVIDALVSQQEQLGYKKQSEFSVPLDHVPIAIQISEKNGLIYIITCLGLISIHNLETAEYICSYKISQYEIICTTKGTSCGSFYAINWKGQIFSTYVNDSAILKFLGGEDMTSQLGKMPQSQKNLHALLVTRGLPKLRLEMLNTIQGLKGQNDELKKKTEEQVSEITEMRRELNRFQGLSQERQNEIEQLRRETEEQLRSMTEKDNYRKSQEEIINRLQTELKTENAKLYAEIKQLTESVKVEENARRETEEQLRAKMTEIDNCRKTQEEMMKTIQYFQLLKEANNLEANFIEYTCAELKKVTNGFSNSLMIGEGGYGPVYKAFLGLTPVAIKILKYKDNEGNKQFNQEVDILSKIRHPNLVMLLGASREAQALVYELMPNGSLYDMLRNKQTPNALTAKKRICIASNICSALIFLHSAKPHGIVHGDLKSANILLDSNYMGKLSDFGICRRLEKTGSRNTAHHYTETLKGTRPYMDPECFSEGEMTAEYDVYSFGIVLLELVTGRDPMGLRKWAEDALSKGKIFVDASAGKWPLQVALKMVHLGLRCSEFSRKERPNLEKEVLPEIESMLLASLHF